MSENDYIQQLKAALDTRRDWFDKTELPKFKEEFRKFHNGISTLYSLFTNKGVINEDPYKNDTMVNELSVPPAGPFNDSNKRDQLGIRLSALDNGIDFLVNFYEFSTDNFTQENLKVIIGLVKYIDWVHLTPDGINVTTQALSEVVTNMRQGITDQITAKTVTDALAMLAKSTKSIINTLKLLSGYNRELYKYDMRVNITSSMSAAEATTANIKKKINSQMRGAPFYAELVDELVKEDYSADSASLREKVLQGLTAGMQVKKNAAKEPVSFKSILIDGLNSIGIAGVNLAEIRTKISENSDLLENQKSGFWAKIKNLLAQMTNKKPDMIVYEIEYMSPEKNSIVREKVDMSRFYAMLDKKISILGAVSARGNAEKKLELMDENQLIDLLQRNIKDVDAFHKTLNGLDEYFKNAADKDSRQRVKGIKPELSALKNSIAKASDKLRDYHARYQEQEQFKKLGIDIYG
ncbi:MAG: hypothetical protein LBF80_05990 [Spirochaetaceae bacterium]|jgi:hypothetical protein|nr:hypothetical protein [Spirochaetaceae bacterium]